MITKQQYFNTWLLGFISGFTLMISGNTLNFWLAKENIDIRIIGVFSLISAPYAINFLWAPLFDSRKIKINLYGNVIPYRISWVIIIQILLAISILILSYCAPISYLHLFAIIGFIIALLSSTQDTILGAIRSDMIDKELQGGISGIYVFGYRIGMLMSGSGAILLSSYIGWNLVYKFFGLVVLIFPLIFLTMSQQFGARSIKEQQIYYINTTNANSICYKIKTLIIDILKPVGSPKFIILVLIFLILYRLPDNFIMTMINPFLLHIGYNEVEIAVAGKFFGTIAAIIGGLWGSQIMQRKNIYHSLFIFGLLHALIHSMFILQEILGKNIFLLFTMIGLEGITGGMCMAAYIAFIPYLCRGKYKATQYSFFSSMMGLSRAVIPASAGYIVNDLGWINFYCFAIIATIPALIMIWWIKIISISRT